MKKLTKFAAILLPALVLAMALPGIACAKTVKMDTVYVNVAPETHYVSWGYYTDEPTTCTFDSSRTKGELSKAKSSNTEVATAKIVTSKDQYGKHYILHVQCKKAGKATITWKKNGVTYKKKIVVDDFTNPFKKITINGKNVTKKFNKSNVIELKYSKWKDKEIVIKYKVKKGWKDFNAGKSGSSEYDSSTGTYTYKTKASDHSYVNYYTLIHMTKDAGNNGNFYAESFYLLYV